jgi:hypothetical protein
MYWPLRLRLGLHGSRKRRKTRPSHWQGVLIDDDSGTETPLAIEVGKFPPLYVIAEFPPPGILLNRPLSDSNPELQIKLKGDAQELERFTRELGASRFEIEFNWHWDAFNRLLAKIGHAFAVAILGMDGFEHFLTPLILGQSAYFSHYIGGVTSQMDELAPPRDLQLGIREIDTQPMVFARTTIFGNRRFPTYEIVVGRITDLDLIRRKIALTAQRYSSRS